MRFGGPICVIVPNFVPISDTVAEIWSFLIIQDGGRPPSWILKSSRLQLPIRFGVRGSVRGIVSNFVSIGQTVSEIWPFFDFSPSWISFTCLDHPRSVVGSLYRYAEFGRNCSCKDMRF